MRRPQSPQTVAAARTIRALGRAANLQARSNPQPAAHGEPVTAVKRSGVHVARGGHDPGCVSENVMHHAPGLSPVIGSSRAWQRGDKPSGARGARQARKVDKTRTRTAKPQFGGRRAPCHVTAAGTSPAPISTRQQQNADNHQHMYGNENQARLADRDSHFVITSNNQFFPIAGIASLCDNPARRTLVADQDRVPKFFRNKAEMLTP